MGCRSAGFHGLLSPCQGCVSSRGWVPPGVLLPLWTDFVWPAWVVVVGGGGAHVKFNHVLSILRYLPLHTHKKSQIPSLGVYLRDFSEGIY